MKKEKVERRRNFLKKLAYTTPIVTALGQLIKPTNIKAGSQPVGPPSGGFPRSFGQ